MSAPAIWRSEFGEDYAVPAIFDQLVEAGVLSEYSWKNDICPSYGTETDTDTEIRIWVEHPDPTKRELEGQKRFLVSVYENGDGIDEADSAGFETDDLKEAIEDFFFKIRKYSTTKPVKP